MRVFRFLLSVALAASLVLLTPCRMDSRGGRALAEAGASPSRADAPADEGTAERLAVGALRLALLPLGALSRVLTACEEKQGEEAPGWIRESAELLRALVDELQELLPAAPEDSPGPKGDISVIRPSPLCKLRLV